jgi:4-hydroxy-2-oxoheptanedioate aldolase
LSAAGGGFVSRPIPLADRRGQTAAMTPVEAHGEALAARKARMGCCVPSCDAPVSDTLVADCLWVDLEHSSMSQDDHLPAARANRMPVIVCMPGVGVPFVKLALDAGADGMVVAQACKPAEVRSVVSDGRYPPTGTRGFRPRVPSRYGGISATEVVQATNRRLFVEVQIETREALEVLEEIALVPGPDSVVAGLWDFSRAMGVLGEVESPVIIESIKRIVLQAKRAGVFVSAGMGIRPSHVGTPRRLGVEWFQVGGGCDCLAWAADRIAVETREARGD